MLYRILLILCLCVGLSSCLVRDKYRNSYRVSDSSMRIDDLGKDFGGAMIHFFAKSGDSASLQFSGMRELHDFYVDYLDENGEIKDEKLRELKKRMEELK